MRDVGLYIMSQNDAPREYVLSTFLLPGTMPPKHLNGRNGQVRLSKIWLCHVSKRVLNSFNLSLLFLNFSLHLPHSIANRGVAQHSAVTILLKSNAPPQKVTHKASSILKSQGSTSRSLTHHS